MSAEMPRTFGARHPDIFAPGANYIVYMLDEAGKIRGAEWIAAAGDEEAIAQARRFSLWTEFRFAIGPYLFPIALQAGAAVTALSLGELSAGKLVGAVLVREPMSALLAELKGSGNFQVALFRPDGSSTGTVLSASRSRMTGERAAKSGRECSARSCAPGTAVAASSARSLRQLTRTTTGRNNPNARNASLSPKTASTSS